MCHLAIPGPDGRAKHFLRVGICPPTECPTACGIGKYSQCPDPTGQGGPWMPADQKKKADFRKQVKKKALGEKILICESCLKAKRRCVYQGHNPSQHITAKKNIGCTADSNFKFYPTFSSRAFMCSRFYFYFVKKSKLHVTLCVSLKNACGTSKSLITKAYLQ